MAGAVCTGSLEHRGDVRAEWCQGVQLPEIPVDLGPGGEEVFPERCSPRGKEGRKRLPEEPKGVQMGVPRALKWYHRTRS